jgi:hypothetical protein
MDSLKWLTLVKYVAVLVAAMVIGNWFLAEVKKVKFTRRPWYKPYVSLPGLIILAALSLPLFFLPFSR